ncbi:hypothetical protein AB3S75_039965 [Citrus x aurantiifolia]
MTMTKMWWPTMAMTTLKIETLKTKVLTMYLGRFALNWSSKTGINCGSSFNAVTNFIWQKTTNSRKCQNYCFEDVVLVIWARDGKSLVNSHGEAKQAFGESSSDSNEVEFSGGGGKDEPSTLEDTGGNLLLRGKQGSQTSDQPKEEYIHVGAGRGQATNTHSLVERVRREKISERMKFLQNLSLAIEETGCS